MSENRSAETHPHSHQESFSPWPPSGADLPDYPVERRPARTPSWAHPDEANGQGRQAGSTPPEGLGEGRGGG